MFQRQRVRAGLVAMAAVLGIFNTNPVQGES